MFPYSERENTDGAMLKPNISKEIRVKRSKILRELSCILKSRFIINNMLREHRVLIEGLDGKIAHGYTENYIKVKIENSSLRVNQLVSIKPTINNSEYLIL